MLSGYRIIFCLTLSALGSAMCHRVFGEFAALSVCHSVYYVCTPGTGTGYYCCIKLITNNWLSYWYLILITNNNNIYYSN